MEEKLNVFEVMDKFLGLAISLFNEHNPQLKEELSEKERAEYVRDHLLPELMKARKEMDEKLELISNEVDIEVESLFSTLPRKEEDVLNEKLLTIISLCKDFDNRMKAEATFTKLMVLNVIQQLASPGSHLSATVCVVGAPPGMEKEEIIKAIIESMSDAGISLSAEESEPEDKEGKEGNSKLDDRFISEIMRKGGSKTTH